MKAWIRRQLVKWIERLEEKNGIINVYESQVYSTAKFRMRAVCDGRVYVVSWFQPLIRKGDLECSSKYQWTSIEAYNKYGEKVMLDLARTTLELW